MSNATPDISSLFSGAQQDGTVTANLASIAINDLGSQIQQGLGVNAAAVSSSEVYLCIVIVDDSGSIASAAVRGPGGQFMGSVSHEQDVRDGHNGVIDALMKSKSEGDVLMLTTALNRGVISPFSPIASAKRLDSQNYAGDGGTPLYEQVMATLMTVVAKEQEFANEGVPCRTATLIVTDGNDQHSRKYGAADVAALVTKLRAKENHIIAAMGIDDGRTDFRKVFEEMGIDPRWIMTPQNTDSEIRKAFGVFSKTSARASQGAAAFSQTAGGGFTTI